MHSREKKLEHETPWKNEGTKQRKNERKNQRTNERRRTRGRVNTTKRQHRLVTRRQNQTGQTKIRWDKAAQANPRQKQSPRHTAQTEKATHTRCTRQANKHTQPKKHSETHTLRPRDTDGHRQTEGPSDTNGDRQTKQMQTNAENPEKHKDEQHTNKKSVIAVFVSLHPAPCHLKTFKISDFESEPFGTSRAFEKGTMTALQRR